MGKLIIDGNQVYELDEACMKRKRMQDQKKAEPNSKSKQKPKPPQKRF